MTISPLTDWFISSTSMPWSEGLPNHSLSSNQELSARTWRPSWCSSPQRPRPKTPIHNKWKESSRSCKVLTRPLLAAFSSSKTQACPSSNASRSNKLGSHRRGWRSLFPWSCRAQLESMKQTKNLIVWSRKKRRRWTAMKGQAEAAYARLTSLNGRK